MFVEVVRRTAGGIIILQPLAGGEGADGLGGEGEVAGDTDEGLRRHLGGQLGEEFVVAVGCLDEYLRLVVAEDALLDALEGFLPLLDVEGEVAEEGEVLPVEPRGHEAEDDGARAHEGTTSMPRCWARATMRAPGSAMQGTPASDMRPMSFPSARGSRKEARASSGVCSLSSKKTVSSKLAV